MEVAASVAGDVVASPAAVRTAIRHGALEKNATLADTAVTPDIEIHFPPTPVILESSCIISVAGEFRVHWRERPNIDDLDLTYQKSLT